MTTKSHYSSLRHGELRAALLEAGELRGEWRGVCTERGGGCTFLLETTLPTQLPGKVSLTGPTQFHTLRLRNPPEPQQFLCPPAVQGQPDLQRHRQSHSARLPGNASWQVLKSCGLLWGSIASMLRLKLCILGPPNLWETTSSRNLSFPFPTQSCQT